ncbi:MAG TPA: TonB-dependent receptor [Vicinamibacterales bacterium]|nr:TonB-dependent receptor [Vicinamibacterales bacterium]
MLLALILSLSLADPSITGVVKDADGGAIVGASVVVKSASGDQQTVTGPDGHFSLETAPSGAATLIVKAGGFAVMEETLPGTHDIQVVLKPAAVLENVTVTPSRTEQRLGDVAASVNVVDHSEIQNSPATVTDDVLRTIPTFSLFTRASSLSSHPTSQGVSLRGIGPSGVSRTLVMNDGVPVNDPFGGWVFWTRFPLDTVDRIEVVDGPNSSLYGNYAMGGVINILSTRASRRTIELKPQYGNLSSPKIDYFGSDVWGKLGVTIDGSAFDTDGFPTVVAAEAGPVDDKATVQYHNTNVKLSYNPTSRVSTFVRGGYFHEQRNNGKHSTVDGTEESNHTGWGYASDTTRLDLPGGNLVQATVFTNDEHFFSNFLAVPAATPVRSIGRISLNQTVPTDDLGSSVQWSRAFGQHNFVSVGGDFHWVKGDSQEDGLDATTGTSVITHRVSGGRQKSSGAYVQDIITPLPNLTLTFAARIDYFDNYDAHNLENSVSNGVIGSATVNNAPTLPGRTDTVATPRASAMYRVSDHVNIWGDANTGFRAPTLNELYRQFKKGTTTTLPNYELQPERLVGGELGTSIAIDRFVTLRVTGFDNRVKNPVTNVTMPTAFVPIPLASGAAIPSNAYSTTASCTPSASVICVLRQNVGKTEIRGVQTDLEFHYKNFRATAGYVNESATVIENNTTTSLVGNFLAEVPRNRGSFQVSYLNPKFVAVSVDEQFVGAQFDDDQNTRLMPTYKTTNFTATRQIAKGFDVFFGMQNMFNVQYVVATLPTTIGSPRLYNGGFRIRWSGK